jgi:hypothetical protein
MWGVWVLAPFVGSCWGHVMFKCYQHAIDDARVGVVNWNFNKKNIIHVVKDHNMDQKGRDNKSGKNLFWNISTYAHVSFHEIGFVSNLILFKETFVISRYKSWILYFLLPWEGKSFACYKWVWSTIVVSIISLCISFLIQMLQVK